MRTGRVFLSIGLAAVALTAFAPVARADDSLIKVSEVYSDGSANHGDFVEMQLSAAGQQIADGHSMILFNPTASSAVVFDLSGLNTLVDSQRTILIGWNDNPVADVRFSSGLNPIPVGGAICLEVSPGPPVVPIDCVSWGTFTPGTSIALGAGTPAPALNAAQSLTRSIAPNCATLLEPADDTNNSLTDFALAAPSPRNNFTTPTETPCPTPAAPVVPKKKCKKHKKHRSAASAKKKSCKKRKR